MRVRWHCSRTTCQGLRVSGVEVQRALVAPSHSIVRFHRCSFGILKLGKNTLGQCCIDNVKQPFSTMTAGQEDHYLVVRWVTVSSPGFAMRVVPSENATRLGDCSKLYAA